jgi:hypothetical protein
MDHGSKTLPSLSEDYHDHRFKDRNFRNNEQGVDDFRSSTPVLEQVVIWHVFPSVDLAAGSVF